MKIKKKLIGFTYFYFANKELENKNKKNVAFCRRLKCQKLSGQVFEMFTSKLLVKDILF